MKPITITIIKYSSILLASFLIAWLVVVLSPLDIPEFIPYTPIKVYGLFLCGFILTILIFSQKELLKKRAALSIVNLTLFGTAICLINEVIFQFILSFTETSDKLHYFIEGTITTTIFCAVLSFFVACQLKTKRTGMLVLFILVVIVLFKVLTVLFPTIFET